MKHKDMATFRTLIILHARIHRYLDVPHYETETVYAYVLTQAWLIRT